VIRIHAVNKTVDYSSYTFQRIRNFRIEASATIARNRSKTLLLIGITYFGGQHVKRKILMNYAMRSKLLRAVEMMRVKCMHEPVLIYSFGIL
jgi:hypothetical protein